MKTEDVVRGVIELGNISKELEGLQKEISERKQEKGQLVNDINVLKKSQIDEKNRLSKIISELEKIISDLKIDIGKLNSKKQSISSSISAEYLKLNSQKDIIAIQLSQAEAKARETENGSKLLTNNQAEFEKKKELLKQIGYLISKL